MTLQEAKNEVAKRHGFATWEAMDSEWIYGKKTLKPAHYDEVMEVYARSKWDEACEEQIDLVKDTINDEYQYEFKKPEFKP